MLIEAGANNLCRLNLKENIIPYYNIGLTNLEYKKNYKQFTFKFVLKRLPIAQTIWVLK